MTVEEQVAAPADATPVAAEAATGGVPAQAEGPAPLDDLQPQEIVRRLDTYIVGQGDAKRAVAIAIRNRVRRQRLPDEMRYEVIPKNILMIGPTGVGKTEIARRLARLTRSPFIKVEATKFTEVGYVGRDVESIVRDLLEQTISEIHHDRTHEVAARARANAQERILDALIDADSAARDARAQRRAPTVASEESPSERTEPEDARMLQRRRRALRNRMRRKLEQRQLEDTFIDIEVEEPFQPSLDTFAASGMEEMGLSLSDFFSQMAPPRKRMKHMTVADARQILIDEETDRLIDMDRVYDDVIKAVEDDGIIFIDEIDKICGRSGTDHGPDVSGEGVQRDLLPLLEGSTVQTRYGPVRTEFILFVSAGAFTAARPSDLIPEFQGRFPIRVELQALSEADLQRILVEPSNALTKQYTALLATEGVTLEFAESGLAALAEHAHRVNEQDENVGARRLFTMLEKVLEDLSFTACEHAGETVVVDAGYVNSRLGDLVRNDDVRRYIL